MKQFYLRKAFFFELKGGINIENNENFTVLKVKKDNKNSILKGAVRFELKRTGPDLTHHDGVEYVYLRCPHCGAYAKFSPKHTIIVDQGEQEYGDVKDFHTLAVCENCNDVVYVKFYEVDFDPDWWFDYEYHHPQYMFEFTVLTVPESIVESFSEAHKCLQAGAYLASVVMCRRTIEALLNDKGIKNYSTLAKGIEKLSGYGVLHESMINVADVIRLIGNTGAHFTNKRIKKKEQAQEAYELTKGLIETIYFLPDKVKAIKEKISKKS